MKRFKRPLSVFILVAALAICGLAQSTPTCTQPDMGFGGGIGYDPGASPKVNGGVFFESHIANLPCGTWLVNNVDFIYQGHGVLTPVPNIDLRQHIMFLGSTDKIELFGLLGGGVALQAQTTGTLPPVATTNVSAAFAGGAGLKIRFGGGWAIEPMMNLINTNGVNTLGGRVYVRWDSYPTPAQIQERVQKAAARAARKAEIRRLKNAK